MIFFAELIKINCCFNRHAQILAGLKTWCLWLVVNKRETNHQISDMVTATTSILLNGPQESAKLSLSAAHLLLCLTNITFPPNLITLPPIIELLHTSPIIRYQDEHVSIFIIFVCVFMKALFC